MTPEVVELLAAAREAMQWLQGDTGFDRLRAAIAACEREEAEGKTEKVACGTYDVDGVLYCECGYYCTPDGRCQRRDPAGSNNWFCGCRGPLVVKTHAHNCQNTKSPNQGRMTEKAPEPMCVCGEPEMPGTVHSTVGPCFRNDPDERKPQAEVATECEVEPEPNGRIYRRSIRHGVPAFLASEGAE